MHRMSKHDRQALKRIVALLFAFAALAELAGSKPRPLRSVVLWFLRPAEAIGRDFVSAMVEDWGGPDIWPAQVSSLDDADDNICLAHSFRALAELLGDLIRRGLVQRPSGRTSRRQIQHLMLNLRNLIVDHPALAHATPEPLSLDSS